MEITISVTEKHINESNKRKKSKNYRPSCQCPIALSLKDKFPSISVGILGAYDYNTHTGMSFPDEISNWIKEFDSGNKVNPITFQAEIFDSN